MGFAAAHMPPAPIDHAVVAPDGSALLWVETKARRATEETWATAWRRKYPLPGVPVLLVTADRMFGWGPSAAGDQAPEFTLDAVPLLSPYLTAIASGGRLDARVFEWVVGSWLQDLLAGDPQPIPLGALGDWLQSWPRGASVVSDP